MPLSNITFILNLRTHAHWLNNNYARGIYIYIERGDLNLILPLLKKNGPTEVGRKVFQILNILS